MYGTTPLIDVLREGKERNLFRDEGFRRVCSEITDSVYAHIKKLSDEDERAYYGLRRELVELAVKTAAYESSYGNESERIVNKYNFHEVFKSSASRRGYGELLYLFVKTVTLTEGGDRSVDFQPVADARIQTTSGERYIACYAMMVSHPSDLEESGDMVVEYVGHIKLDPNDPFEIGEIGVYRTSNEVMEKEEIEDMLGCPYENARCLIKIAGPEIFSPGEEIPTYKYIESQLIDKLGEHLLQWIKKLSIKKFRERLPHVFIPSYSNDEYPREVW